MSKLYKQISILLLFIFGASGLLCAQASVDLDSAKGNTLFAASGDPYINIKFVRLVSGSQFAVPAWSKGFVILRDGNKTSEIMLRLNLAENLVHFLDKSGKELVTDKVRDVIFTETSSGKRFVFRKGFPPVGNATEKTFYQLLCDNKFVFAKFIDKVLSEERAYGSSTYDQTIRDVYSYYLFIGGNMYKIKLDKNSLGEVLPDQKTLIADFIAKNHLQCRSQEDIVSVLNYLNGL